MRFVDLLARADEGTLREIIGPQALRTLRCLDDSFDRPAVLRTMLSRIRSPASILRDAGSRTALLLTLPRDGADRLAAALGSTGNDPYAYLSQLNPGKNTHQERALFEWFGVEAVEEPPAETPLTTAASPSYPMHQYQRQVVRDASTALESPPHRVLMHMPTGAGKTRTAMNLIADYLRSGEPRLAVWLAYSEELCSQAADEFEAAWNNLGNRRVSTYRFWSDSSADLESCFDGLVVLGLSKAYARAKSDLTFLSKLSDRADMVIIDEAHQAIAETYRFVLETLINRRPGVRLLGLSATPGRTWNDPSEDARLSEFFGLRKVTLATGDISPVEFLVNEGFLARPEFHDIQYHGGTLTSAEAASLAQDLEIPASVLQRLADDEQRNLIVLRSIEALLRNHDRVLVFAATVSHAETLALVLTALGHEADVVTGSTPRGERRQIIERFRSAEGPPRVLCNFGVLTAGFDAPRTNAAVIARPTKSLVLYSQMVGRVVRGPRSGGHNSAAVHTVVDTTLPGFGHMSEAFLNWEDVWEGDQSD